MDPAQLQPGYRLDRYELLCPLAYGGMASVWLARFGGRLGFERLVVVKMILPQFSQDPRFQQMFLDEARIASRIEHPNVARILDVGEHDGNYFIVMEWVDGDSLSKVLRSTEQKKQHIPAGIALRICADAAAGLHAAHGLHDRDGHPLGVVHRDVSPQNILISNTGTTALIDFGVAKARDRVSQDTLAGQLKGKIRYMAPEQALGRALDHRADLWSVGAMLYEMFAGTAPYEGPNEVATLHKLTSRERPPELPERVPDAVRAVVERALAYDPDDRFANALELNLALEGAMVEIGEPTSPSAVAQYTAQLLAERKAARRKAVDAALAAARAREATGGNVGGAATNLVMHAGAVIAADGPSFATRGPRAASRAGGTASVGPNGLGESPSANSHTLGSAAMEYLPEPPPAASGRRKYTSAAFFGMSLASGVVGIALIVSAAVMKKPEEHVRAASPPASASVAPPAPAPPPPESPAEPALVVTTTATASPDSSRVAAPAASAAPSSSSTTPPGPASAHRPAPSSAPVTPTKAKVAPPPSPSSAPAPKKTDYGF